MDRVKNQKKQTLCHFLFVRLPRAVDSAWRRGEYHANRNHCYDPLTPAISLRPRQYGWSFVIFVVVAFYAAYGPTFAALAACDRGGLALLGLLALILGVGVIGSRKCGWLNAHWPLAQGILLWLIAALVWRAIASADAREAENVPYRNSFLVFATAVVAVPWLAFFLARRLFPPKLAGMDVLHAALGDTELFVDRGADSQPTTVRIMHAVVNGPIYHPLQWLLPPSFVALSFADDWLLLGWSLAALGSTFLLIWGSTSARWQEMVTHVDRWFFTGTPLAISLLVIALGSARLAGIDYVATVLSSAPFGIVFSWVIMLYALFWHLEFAINEPLGRALLGILGQEPAGRGFIRCPLRNAVAWNQTVVEIENRYLAVHGAGRFAVVGRFFKNNEWHAAFHTYSFFGLLSALAAAAPANRIPSHSRSHCSAIFSAANELERRIKLYFDLLNFAVILVVGAALYYVFRADGPTQADAVVEARVDVAGGFDLASHLRGQPQAVVVAASGGGTRAALYTAEVLRGLHRAGFADAVQLMSGVSGGGVALAYFAAHRQQLLGAAPDSADWNEFSCRMSEPFIADVIAGATEARIASRAPLSTLLAESLEQRLGSVPFGAVRHVGLLLNTTVAGHPHSASSLLRQAVHTHDPELPYRHRAGARLIFGNLDPRVFPTRDGALEDLALPMAVSMDPQVSLYRAAALNANFPPVFPNSRVDLIRAGQRQSYYVTDGGVVENLGMISALLALRETLRSLAPAERPRRIRLVALEASAMNIDYSQDHALGALAAGKERLAAALMLELLNDLKELIGKNGEVRLHVLPMPLALTSRGGIGTHWMLPGEIAVQDSRLPQPAPWWRRFWRWARGDAVHLDRAQIGILLRSLHEQPGALCGRFDGRGKEALDTVSGWICDRDGDGRLADPHLASWKMLLDDLRSGSPSAVENRRDDLSREEP